MPALLVNPSVVHASPEVGSQVPGVTFAWTIADLPPHTGGEIRVRAEVDPAAVPPIGIINWVEITSETPDVNLLTNRSWAGIGLTRIYLPLVTRPW
jgi:hypothetical protein